MPICLLANAHLSKCQWLQLSVLCYCIADYTFGNLPLPPPPLNLSILTEDKVPHNLHYTVSTTQSTCNAGHDVGAVKVYAAPIQRQVLTACFQCQQWQGAHTETQSHSVSVLAVTAWVQHGSFLTWVISKDWGCTGAAILFFLLFFFSFLRGSHFPTSSRGGWGNLLPGEKGVHRWQLGGREEGPTSFPFQSAFSRTFDCFLFCF